MQTFEEFRSAVKKAEGKGRRKVLITNSFGIYDIYKLIRKNRWYNIGRPLKEHEFYTIVRSINKMLAEEIALGHEVRFPEGMGRLELRKSTSGVSLIDGRLKNTYPINWDGTLRLWYEDEEERKKKTLLRLEEPMVYRVKYLKHDATYENKIFYQFKLNRFIQRALKENIKKGITDTIW